jgi:hypothetical protein
MHDDAPNLATAFVAEVSRTAGRSRQPLTRMLNPLPAAVLSPTGRKLRTILGVLIAMIAAGIALWFVTEHLEHIRTREANTYQATVTTTTDPSGTVVTRSEASPEPRTRNTNIAVSPADIVDTYLQSAQMRIVGLGAFFTAIAGLLGVLIKVATWVFTSGSLSGFMNAPDKAAETGNIEAAHRQLGRLVRQATWRGNRFVVFIDDVERCKPPRSVDVLDAVNQLMDHKGVIVVLLGDMSAVAAAAQIKYKELAEIFVPSSGVGTNGADRSKEAFGRLYLQKIVQFQFDLPIPPRSKIHQYMEQLATTPAQGGAVGGSAV